MTLYAHVVGSYSFEGAARAARELMALKRRPDAIFAANDQMAFSVIDVVRSEYGMRVPQDISIIGYDDVPQASCVLAVSVICVPHNLSGLLFLPIWI